MMMRIFKVTVNYTQPQRTRGFAQENGYYIETDLVSLMERLMLKHGQAHELTVADLGEAR
jgi:hypothetical protein